MVKFLGVYTKIPCQTYDLKLLFIVFQYFKILFGMKFIAFCLNLQGGVAS